MAAANALDDALGDPGTAKAAREDWPLPPYTQPAAEEGSDLLDKICANLASPGLEFCSLGGRHPRASGLPSPATRLQALARQMRRVGSELRAAVWRAGTVRVLSPPALPTDDCNEDGAIHFVYEVDGFGNSYSMDDANVPSLLSLPYLGFLSSADPVYVATRGRLLHSQTNPFFFKGAAGEGIGSPHVGPGYIWPMSIIMRALTRRAGAPQLASLTFSI